MTFGKSTVFAFAMIGLSGVALLGACSGKTSSAAPVALADLPAAYAHAICDNIKGCCAQTNFPYDDAKCVDTYTADLKAKIATLNATYDANAAGECVATFQSIAASCGPLTDSDTEKACSRVFTGPKKLGESCNREASDCAPSPDGQVYCESTGSATVTSSRCVLIRPAQVGDACGFSFDGSLPTTRGDCTSSTSAFYCADATKTCQPRLAIGAECSGTFSCVSGAACVNGKCATAPTAGQPCDDSFSCATGFYCDVSTRSCTAKKKPGDACNFGEGSSCNGGSCSNGTCTAGSLADRSTCAGIPNSQTGNNGG